MKRKLLSRLLFVAVLLLPLWMWLAWLAQPQRKLVAAIVDKTVLDDYGQEHISLTWILNHRRFTKTRDQGYASDHDYFGFFPLADRKFRLKGLERLSNTQLDQLSAEADLAYYTDTYGIYKKEWYAGTEQTERSGILYGGMSRKDVAFLIRMKERHKLVMAEFNDINSPTDPGVRQQFEAAFGLKWTGWIGRYFDSLDTLDNADLPRWLVRDYQRQHGGRWPFHQGGVAFVSEGDVVVVLEDNLHLARVSPYMEASEFGQREFGLPSRIRYTYWFDVLSNNPRVNREVASHQLYVSEAGRAELRRYGLPERFPAILMHKAPDYEFYYFAGDFCDSPINLLSAHFRGIGMISPLFHWAEGRTERKSFFWRVYRPMVTVILEDYYARKVKK
jgi:hypothetical protein